MKCAFFDKPKSVVLKQIESPRIKESSEVLIQIKGVGICGTDLNIYRGKFEVDFPHIGGHECIGIVKKVGSKVKTIKVGDCVTVDTNFSCGTCLPCREGLVNICFNKKILGVNIAGCFCEYVVVQDKYVWKLPEDISLEQGVMIEPSSVALHAVKKANIHVGEKVLIFGAGAIGILIMQFCLLSGANVSICDINQNRLDLATNFGVNTVYNANSDDPPVGGFDIVFDAAGVSSTIRRTTLSVRKGGKILLLGIPESFINFDIKSIVRNELQVLGSAAYTTEYPEVIEFISQDKIRVEELVTHELKLEELEKGLELMEKGEAIRPMIIV